MNKHVFGSQTLIVIQQELFMNLFQLTNMLLEENFVQKSRLKRVSGVYICFLL